MVNSDTADVVVKNWKRGWLSLSTQIVLLIFCLHRL